MSQLDNIIDVQELDGESLASMLSVVYMLAEEAEGYDELFKLILAVS